MPSPGAVQVLILVALTRLASTQSVPSIPSTHKPTLSLPCCFASAQNATSLGPVVVLRRDDEHPSPVAPPTASSASMGLGGGQGGGGAAGAGGAADPTWEATLRRAATRALTWEGLTDAPFVASYHSPETLAALDEPGDIRVLARGLLVADRDGRPVFREVDLPGEKCVECPADLPGPNGESIKAMWSVRRIRHSGPNADHRPCYELQFSVTPIAPALAPLSRWEPPGQGGVEAGNPSRGLRAGLRAESRVSRQRELRPKGLILRVNPVPDTVPLQQLAANALASQQAEAAVGLGSLSTLGTLGTAAVGASPGNTVPLQKLAASALAANGLATQRTDGGRGTSPTTPLALGTPAVTVLASEPRPTKAQRVHEHLHHHFYVQGGVPLYAGSTTETEFPSATPSGTPSATPPFRPSPQYHEYSQPDPLYHLTPGLSAHAGQHVGHVGHVLQTGHSGHAGHVHYPNSINEQLPPVRDGADTRVPYVSASKQTAVTPSGTPAPASATPRPTTPRPSQRAPTTMRFPVETEGGPTVTILPSTSTSTLARPGPTRPGARPGPSTQMYRIVGGYTFTTPNSEQAAQTAQATRPAKPSKSGSKHRNKNKVNKVPSQNYFEVGRPTKAYPTSTLAEPHEATELEDLNPTMATSGSGAGSTGSSRLQVSATTARPEVTSSEYLSEYPAATVRGTTPTVSTPAAANKASTQGRPTAASRIPLFTPHYGKDFEMSILKVMTSKVPSYIDIFTENGVRVTTVRPDVEETTMHSLASQTSQYSNKYGKHTKALITSMRLFKENPDRGPYSLVTNSTQVDSTQHQKLSTTLHTRVPEEDEPSSTGINTHSLETSTPSSPLQITFFVATEDEAKQPSASTLVSDPFRQDDATTYQYTILRSVEQSINVMKHENDTINEELRTSTEPMSSTRRIFTGRDEPKGSVYQESRDTFATDSLPSTPDKQSIVNGHTNHINAKSKYITESYSQLLKNLTLSTEAPTTRKPWRPSTRARRPWRQRSSYKDYYLQKRGQNHTTTASSVDPTSIVESRKTYSITASRKRKPSQGQHVKSLHKNQKPTRRGEQSDYHTSTAENLHTSPSSDLRQAHRGSNHLRRFFRPSSEHPSLRR